MISNTSNSKIPPLPVWAILFKSSPKSETPSTNSQEIQYFTSKESVYKEMIQSNPKFDAEVDLDNIKRRVLS